MKSGANPPPLKHYFGEARLPRDWLRGRMAERRLARNLAGDGRAVIVVPGLFTNDARMTMLRRVLKRAGYRTYGWGLGHNMPIKADVLERFDKRVREVQDREGGERVALVGWSLGGLVAREYAKFAPDRVSQVVTLGSPFSGHPRSNRAWRIYELIADHKVDSPPLNTILSEKPPVRTTAIWSRRDGIIAAEAARGQADERDETIEVSCGHLGMASAPDALEAVLKALAR